MTNQGTSPVAEISGRTLSANDSYAPATAVTSQSDGQDDDDIVEQDPSGRFTRYGNQVGSGRFKQVYRGFDERRGLDIAWSKISSAGLSAGQMLQAVEEISSGVGLEHANVIRCYQCWLDEDACCINLITEFFTSGNLRDYRQRHRSLDLRAVRKWARQILQGLAYLHANPAVGCHGDLRCDKIYINGHSGEIKIGDLGLAVLVPKRFAPGVMPEGDPKDQYTSAIDIFAYGLVVLELVTGRVMDREHQASDLWQAALEGVADPQAAAFIQRCLAPSNSRPTAQELMEDPFLVPPARRPAGGAAAAPEAEASRRSASGGSGAAGGSVASGSGTSAPGSGPGSALPGSVLPSGPDGGAGGPIAGALVRTSDDGVGGGRPGSGALAVPSWSDDERRAECEAGFVRGEDYLFQFSGKFRGGKLHFRLHMSYEGEGGPDVDTSSKTIDFVYDPDSDTPDDIAAEISNEFNLSSTDTDICAAALKEWLAKEIGDDRD